MSKQNRYQISYEFAKSDAGGDACVMPGETWQQALDGWQEVYCYKGWDKEYQVVSVKPSEDGRSGIMEIIGGTLYAIPEIGTLRKVKATLIED